jgi:hypothetical protein
MTAFVKKSPPELEQALSLVKRLRGSLSLSLSLVIVWTVTQRRERSHICGAGNSGKHNSCSLEGDCLIML